MLAARERRVGLVRPTADRRDQPTDVRSDIYLLSVRRRQAVYGDGSR
jgi:hypothetical protein